MHLTSRLTVAAALMLGAVSYAGAQSWVYDDTSDKTSSYGPVVRAQSPAATRNVRTTRAQPAVVGPCQPHDDTSDKTVSYGCIKR